VINYNNKTGTADADHSPSSGTLTDSETVLVESPPKLTILEKLRIIPSLLMYMIPLGLVYLFEYFINQGLVSTLKLCEVSRFQA
jgi:battenin